MPQSTPGSVGSEHAAAFVVQQLGGRRRVLCVGGDVSGVAARLSTSGLTVSTVRADELATLDDTFDAIFASHCLSRGPLDSTIDHAARLLSSGGRLVVDDLDAQAIDAMSLRWFYDVQELLAVAGLYAQDRVHAANPDLVARWRDGIRADGIQYNGTDMRVAISARFAIRELKRIEYLYRHISEGLASDARGNAIAAHLRSVERRSIASDTLLAVGLRIVADRVR